jgi:hypothetical protein
VLGEDSSQGNGGFDKAGICAGAGAAIDTDSPDLVHVGHVALQRNGVKPARFSGRVESIRKCLGIAKEFGLAKGACGAETLYMTGRMQNNRRATAILRALD